ncbi:MAG: N-acetyltransferase [Deltaproteobacteria bacterium]|nr:N-acetyltransferase [Deltaproteobacteria bacterium]MBI4374677.1 N-acetyltransferase [Deltaproteobacteria bacterium]
MTSVRVEPVLSRADLLKFIKVPWKIYRDDPAWVPPLIQERKDFLNPKKNPFFEHADVQLFLAYKNGELAGRTSVQIDRLFNEIHKEKTGFFGFFESENDPDVATALIKRCEGWLKEKGMTKVRGPFSFSSMDECGFLVDGFQHSPFILTAHSTPYYPALAEQAGLKKAKDLYCWKYDGRNPIPEMPLAIADEARKHPGLVVREVGPRHLERDVRIIMDIFNSAWSHNWGFVPLTEAEVKKAARDFSLILEPSMVLIAEIDGKPAAFSLSLPNINQAIRDLDGKLFPFGFLKLLYRVKRKKISGFRHIALGVKKEFRGSVLGGLSVLLYVEMHRRGKDLGLKECELSWTLEDNEKINAGIEFMGGERYKTYRIFEKDL